DFMNDVVVEITDFVLRIEQSRHQDRTLRRIMREHLCEARFELIRKLHCVRKMSIVIPSEARNLGLRRREPRSLASLGMTNLKFVVDLVLGSAFLFPITGQFPLTQCLCCQSPPPHPRASGPRTSLAAVEDSPDTLPAYARDTAWRFHRLPRNIPFPRAAIPPPDKPL